MGMKCSALIYVFENAPSPCAFFPSGAVVEEGE